MLDGGVKVKSHLQRLSQCSESLGAEKGFLGHEGFFFCVCFSCVGFPGHTRRVVSSNFTDASLLVWVGCCDSRRHEIYWQTALITDGRPTDLEIPFMESSGLPDLISSAGTLIHPFFIQSWTVAKNLCQPQTLWRRRRRRRSSCSPPTVMGRELVTSVLEDSWDSPFLSLSRSLSLSHTHTHTHTRKPQLDQSL